MNRVEIFRTPSRGGGCAVDLLVCGGIGTGAEYLDEMRETVEAVREAWAESDREGRVVRVWVEYDGDANGWFGATVPDDALKAWRAVVETGMVDEVRTDAFPSFGDTDALATCELAMERQTCRFEGLVRHDGEWYSADLPMEHLLLALEGESGACRKEAA